MTLKCFDDAKIHDAMNDTDYHDSISVSFQGFGNLCRLRYCDNDVDLDVMFCNDYNDNQRHSSFTL